MEFHDKFHMEFQAEDMFFYIRILRFVTCLMVLDTLSDI